MNDEYVDNITMPDRSVWLQLGEIAKYKERWNPQPPATEREVTSDRRIFIKLDEIVSVGRDTDTRAAVVLRGGETICVSTSITETMEIIQAATKYTAI